MGKSLWSQCGPCAGGAREGREARAVATAWGRCACGATAAAPTCGSRCADGRSAACARTCAVAARRR
eukprot:1604104-Amphidinium_carterae.1